MKHAFLRRLSALALALVMAASLCVTPAWAASAIGEPFELDKKLIILGKQNDGSIGTDTLTVPAQYCKDGDTIKWDPSDGATVNNADSEIWTLVKVDSSDPDNPVVTGNSVAVSASSGAKGVVTVTRYDGGTATSGDRPCYVYGGTSPTQDDPTIIPNPVDAGKEATLNIRVLEHADLFQASDIKFVSADPQIAEVGTPTYSNDTFTVKFKGKTPGTVTIRMTLKDVYTKEWKLTVKKSTDVLITFMKVTPDNLPVMTVGDTYDRLKIGQIIPSNATNKEVEWTTDNDSIATVDSNGKVTAVGVGTTNIVATAKDGGGASASCWVAVKEAASSLTVSPTSKTLYTYGKPLDQTTPSTVMITATPAGENSGNVEYKWSGNESVASLSSKTGPSVTVTALKAGTATFTVTATFKNSEGRVTATKTATCAITVLDDKSVAVTGITLNKTEHTMAADDTVTLSVVSVTPANAPVKTVTWESSNENIAKVDPKTGKVTGVAEGQVAIIAKPEFGVTRAVCAVTITPKAEAIRLTGSFDTNVQGTNQYEYTFGNLKDELKVKAVFTPAKAADPVRWTSKDPSVATVSTGTTTQATITAVSPGETTISAIPLDPAGKERVLSTGPAEVTVFVSGLTIQQTVDGKTSTINSLNLAEGRRQTVTFKAYGSADTGGTSCDWSISDPSIVMIGSKTGVSTALTARRPGTATLTARRGIYSATCTVTVGEDTAVTITASTAPGSPLQFSKLADQLRAASTSKTGSSLAYITNLVVASTDQGILHDQHHSSADTGGGVGIQDRYYPGTAPQGQRSMDDLSFVPRNTFSGTAEITYTGWSANNKSFNGTIRVTVNGTGDVMYSSSEGAPVTFLADDFNLYHPNVSSVTFTLPLDSVGTLYYNYISPTQPGTKVSSSTAYSRTGSPSLDRVTFVPAANYTGTARISYKGTDTGGRSFTGVVTITVNGGGNASAPGDIYYPFREDSWTTFQAADFQRASQAVLGESLSYVRFTLPHSSEGTLFYNYRGFGSYDSAVANTTSYYYSGTPALGGVAFVPTTTSPSKVDISYTGYTVRGNTFTGTIHIGEEGENAQPGGLRYTVFTGKSVSLSANDFNTACVAATGASLNYVQFTQLPAVGQGNLRYTRGNTSGYNSISTTTRCYRSSANTWDVQLNNVSFLASSTYTGTVTLPFVGYNTSGTSFNGEVVIQVTPPTTGDSVFYGTTASPLRLSTSRMRSICADALDKDLAYITFTSLPNANAGRLYLGYNRFGSGTEVTTGTRYYASSSPSIDQISFVPRGRYNGQVSVGYIATDTSGKTASGLLTFNITSTGSSNYFNDMGGHTWAAPAVDYLYQNGVTKGVTTTNFGPEQRILRCDFVLMLCRAFGFGENGSGYSFDDVPANAYYAGAVAIAKQRGIINGDGRNFMPNSELTRQDAMVMIYNALKAAGWNVTPASASILSRFPDGTSVSNYARTAVSTLVQLGAVNGDNGMLYPHNPITRAEAAVILHFVMTM